MEISKRYRLSIVEANTGHTTSLEFSTILSLKNALAHVVASGPSMLYYLWLDTYTLDTTTHIITKTSTEITEL